MSEHEESIDVMEIPPDINFGNVGDLQNIYSNLASFGTKSLQNIVSATKILLLQNKATEKAPIDNSNHLLCRIYYRSLDILAESDPDLLVEFDTFNTDLQVALVNGLLFTDQDKYVEFDRLVKLCQQILHRVTKSSTHCALVTFRSVNLMYKKYPSARITFSLSEFYTCLQCQSSAVRDECVIFFKNWIESEKNAQEIFKILVNYWPWSNKFKYILLSVILSSNQLEILINDKEEIETFMQGLTLALRYKGLFSVGQLVVRSLAKNSSSMLNNFLVYIMKAGTNIELIYLNSQWMHYIQNKGDICALLRFTEGIDSILECEFLKDNPFRLVLICTIFEKELQKSPHIEEIVDYMRANCFNFDLQTQLYIFKFMVNNLIATGNRFSEKLQFVINFMNQHLFVPCSDFRNTILGKLPLIVDFLSKIVKSEGASALDFFARLKKVFKSGICHREYQPLIFNLKLFEILLKCCQSTTHKSLLKNSHVKLHRTLAKLLVDQNVWNFQEEHQTILDLLSDCGDFDDVREIIVKILIRLEPSSTQQEFESWKQLVENPDIEKCALSLYYARLCVHRNCLDEHFLQVFFHFCVDKIQSYSKEIEMDALNACKHGHHIFGFFNALCKFFTNKTCIMSFRNKYQLEAVEESRKAVQLVLNKLNLVGSEETNASFQIMEESLEILVSDSTWPSKVHSIDRKFVLLSFWMTLKACCELATNVGLKLVEPAESDADVRKLLKECLSIPTIILHGCRHKGAIESAGVCLGQLVKGISIVHSSETETYKILYGCFDVLFGSVNNISTTRRGAGLSIMFHHFIKNDSQKSRPLFQHAIKILLEHVQKSRSPSHNPKELDECHDNFEALVLHYLCVLVRDSDLKDCISEYYDEIMMSAITRINDKEWTVRNGALQLFGALVPKIVGQKQAAIGESEILPWEPTEITFTEFCIKLPRTNVHILEYCMGLKQGRKSTSSIILFLEFLSSIDYIKKGDDRYSNELIKFREILWGFLSHFHEKVRKLSSKCLVRFHDFHEELRDLVFKTVDLLFTSQNENFIHGLILFYIHSLHKLKIEGQFIPQYKFDDFCVDFQEAFNHSHEKKVFSCYVRRYLVELFTLAKFNFKSDVVKEMLANGAVTISESNKVYLNFGMHALNCKLNEVDDLKT